MAQLNISHFTDITSDESRDFALRARDITAKEVHGLEKSQIEPDTVSVWVTPLDKTASLSGAATEVWVLVSGNDWPRNSSGQPANAAEAKVHFDKLAARVYSELTKKTKRKIYIWVTPFTATGWGAGD